MCASNKYAPQMPKSLNMPQLGQFANMYYIVYMYATYKLTGINHVTRDADDNNDDDAAQIH